MPALDSLPRKIGPYRVIEKIGEGGMGVVYLGTDAEKRRVAVKVLGSAVAGDPSARQRLAREVETMRRVRNRYVAEVLDADVHGPRAVHRDQVRPRPDARGRGAAGRPAARHGARLQLAEGWPRRSPPSTRPAWCTATSSRATSCSTPASRWSSTSASRTCRTPPG